MNNVTFVKIKKLSKSINNELFLNDINFNATKGTIHALAGHNGAGKTLLMKILAGEIYNYTGEINILNKNVSFSSPLEAQNSGIIMFHHEDKIITDISIAENIYISKLPYKRIFIKLLDKKRLNEDCCKIIDNYKLNLNLNENINKLNIVQKRDLLLAKCISKDPNLLILDEPYIGFGEKEKRDFKNILKQLTTRGISIVLISHDVDFLCEIADDISIIKDGKMLVSNLKIAEIKEKDKKIITGQKLLKTYPKLTHMTGRKILSVENITTARIKTKITFDLHKREILGIAGMGGSGKSAIGRALYGIDKLHGGNIYLNGSRIDKVSPFDAIKRGIGYIGENGAMNSVLDDFSIPLNISLSNLKIFARYGIISKKKELKNANKFIFFFNIKLRSIFEKAKILSCGNKAKVILSRCLTQDAKILILDEATKSIDVATKIEVYNFLNKHILNGNSIIFISSNINELMGMCDRILILFNGEIAKILNKNEFTEKEIMYYATGGK